MSGWICVITPPALGRRYGAGTSTAFAPEAGRAFERSDPYFTLNVAGKYRQPLQTVIRA
jgi:hypothetical protein